MSRRLWVALAAITLGAGALRFASLNAQSFWLDEIFSWRLARLPFSEMLDAQTATESNPPLYYVTSWIWAKAFGTSEVGLRSLSALLGTAFVPVAFAAASTLISRKAGLLTALLAATSPTLVWYSQEARSYMLMIFLSGVSLLFFARILRDVTTLDLGAWAAASAAAVLTHYFAGFLVAAEIGALLVLVPQRRRIFLAAATPVLVAAALLPRLREQSGHADWIEDIPRYVRVEEALRQLLTPAPQPPWAGAGYGAADSRQLWWLAVIILVLALSAAVRLGTRDQRRGALIAFSVAAGTILIPLLGGLVTGVAVGAGDYFLDRNVLVAWLPLAIVIAAGLGARGIGAAGPVIVAGLSVAGLATVLFVASNPDWQRDGWRDVVRLIPRDAEIVIVRPTAEAIPVRFYDRSLVETEGDAITARVVALVHRRRDATLLALPPGLEETGRTTDDADRWEVVTYRADAPVAIPGQPGLLARTPPAP